MTENAAIQAVAEAIRRTVGAVETHGPAAVQLAGTYLQYNALFKLLISSAVVGVLAYLIRRLYIWGVSGIRNDKRNEEGYVYALLFGCGVLGAVIIGLTLGTIMDFSLWVSIWSPELALTAKAVSLLK